MNTCHLQGVTPIQLVPNITRLMRPRPDTDQDETDETRGRPAPGSERGVARAAVWVLQHANLAKLEHPYSE
jgi:hypothetical protein